MQGFIKCISVRILSQYLKKKQSLPLVTIPTNLFLQFINSDTPRYIFGRVRICKAANRSFSRFDAGQIDLYLHDYGCGLDGLIQSTETFPPGPVSFRRMNKSRIRSRTDRGWLLLPSHVRRYNDASRFNVAPKKVSRVRAS